MQIHLILRGRLPLSSIRTLFTMLSSESDEYKRSAGHVMTDVIALVLAAVLFLFSDFIAVVTEVLSSLRNLHSRAKWSFLPQT